MIKTTEQLKRDMYDALSAVYGKLEMKYSFKDVETGVSVLEDSLETYLERIRREIHAAVTTSTELHKTNEDLRHGYERQQTRAHFAETAQQVQADEIDQLKALLVERTDQLGAARIDAAKAIEDRDEMQGRMMAVDDAYRVQSLANTVAGDELRKAKAVIVKQRAFIRSLYTARKTRKVRPSTSGQEKPDLDQKAPIRAENACSMQHLWIDIK